ncbi:carboxypeptidase M32 [Erysipelothrix sp. HDW6C]|uniref:carboxypeptidase M32 n=1 Tax=Erysipelothrix sp. HDW6C TaxID=2714930 RepID=UPI00140A4BC8|nr:carboxypeptidase M32 [Erysipelothrix sp. HDW6C]QIK69915.1 carboxypeptidase M32 [Erysipelothrix sp. HDW6C]
MTYQDLLDQLNAYALALNTMSFDAQTIAPKEGATYRNKAMALMAGEYFKLYTSDEAYEILKNEENSEDVYVREGVRVLLKDLEKIKNVPYAEFVAFQELQNNAQISWETAREKKDYNLFKADLDALIATHRKMIAYRNVNLSDYDASLDDYEEGLRMEQVDTFFKTLESDLVPFIDTVIAHQGERPAFLSAFVAIDKQRQISELVMKHLCYSRDFGLLGEAAHPFSSTFSINDTRITTHYHENDFTQSIFSIIHEIGHSMYNHQVNPLFEGTPLADNMSMSIHESQSRFLENMIGRSQAFWTPIYGDLVAIIPDVLSSVSIEDFIKGINYVQRDVIRIEADEITYPLHIMVRYNLERAMFEENHSADGLDSLFAAEMERLIKVAPKDASQGILQDVHWSGASFGYFPTYALGTAYAAQFMVAMRRDLNVEELLERGELSVMFAWLRENIHQYSGSITTQALIQQVSGESFNPHYYVSYIKEKYSKLLGIDFE